MIKLNKASMLAVGLATGLVACGGGSSSPGADGGTNPDGGGPPRDGSNPTPDAPPLDCEGVTPVEGTPALGLEQLPGTYAEPLLALSPEGDPRVFVLERGGRVRIVGGGEFLSVPEITGSPEVFGEQGLLGLAFHPGFATNGRVYVVWSGDGDNHNVHVDEFTVSAADPDVVDPGSQRSIMNITHRYENHNGGMAVFGPDGMLYVSVGDGGSGCDPDENAQDPTHLNGKILRVNVDAGGTYTVPADNPFDNEVWHLGLRNPWRFSFDRETGDLYIGDVGQKDFEEINVAAAGASGLDFGWDTYEADLCHANADGECGPEGDATNTYRDSCDTTNITFPVIQTGDSPSIIGGHVYRGCRLPGYHGRYFYGDYASNWVRSFIWNGSAATAPMEFPSLITPTGEPSLAAIGKDHLGELLFVDINAGLVYRMVPN